MHGLHLSPPLAPLQKITPIKPSNSSFFIRASFSMLETDLSRHKNK